MSTPKPEVHPEVEFYDDYYGPDDYEDDEMAEAEMNCSMMADGQCGLAGSEYCDFECPFRH